MRSLPCRLLASACLEQSSDLALFALEAGLEAGEAAGEAAGLAASSAKAAPPVKNAATATTEARVDNFMIADLSI